MCKNSKRLSYLDKKHRYKFVLGVAITRYPLSIHLRSENDKVHNVEKVTKMNARIISKAHAHFQTME